MASRDAPSPDVRPRRAVILAAALWVLVASLCPADETAVRGDATSSEVSFYRDVRPIFQAHCQGCHQPAKANGALDMTAVNHMLAGGESELPAVVPGQPDESYLIEQITPVDGEAAMPPAADGKQPLAEHEIALIRRWIEEGARDDTPPSAASRIDADNPPVYRGPPVITSLDWSPDGELLAVAGFHEVLLHKADGSGVVARLIGMSARIDSVRFSPDGTKLAVTGGRPAQMGEVQVWDVEGRELLLSVPVTHDSVYGASWSPDGSRIAFGAADSAVRVIDANTGEQVLYQNAHEDWVLDTAFSVEGSHLASVGRDMTAKLIEVPTQRFIDNITSITPGALKGGIQSVRRHPLRDEIIFGGADGTPKIYRMHRSTKRVIGDDANLLWELPPLPGRIFSIDVTPDGRLITAGSSLDGHGHVHVYRMEPEPAVPNHIQAILHKPTHTRSGDERAALQKHFDEGVESLARVEIAEGGVYAVALSPDGSRVAAAGSDGTVRIFDTSSGTLVASFVPVEISQLVEAAGISHDPPPADYLRDVAPILARAGCNQGTCHGSQQGKNGFKLSLRGYDPVFDVRALADDLASRRVNVASPDDSLMLLKATAAVPHEGGQVLKLDSDYYQTVRQWIADGARLDLTSPRVTRLDVTPTNPVIENIGERQQVRVVAHYSDGTERDVTRLAFLESSNTDVVQTVPDQPGRLEALRRGESAVLVRYEGSYASTTLTVMGDREGFVWEEPPANNRIDELVAAKLKRTKTLPSPLVDDYGFVRRLYLDLTGLPPTPHEIQAFIDDERDSRTKRDALIEVLIGSDDYVEYWTNKWADLLLVNRKFLGVEGATALRGWIRAELAANTPYDQFVRKILTASGSTKDHPAAAYYKILRTPDALVENTTHLFLATRFNCNKCHDHPFERWTEDQYYHLAAYFAQVSLSKDPASGDRVIGGSAVEVSQPLYEIVADAPEGEVTHERTGEITAPAFPFEVPIGGRVSFSTEASEVSAVSSVEKETRPLATRREELAAWLTSPDNPYFARSYVNRLWGYLLGRGIIEPLDDIRAGNPPTNPELLDYLTQEFIDSGFDTRHIIGLICKSRTYQLSVEKNRWNEDDEINFSHARARRLPAEVLYDAIYRTTGATSVFPGVAPGTRAATLPDVGIELPDGFLANLGRPARESACECERTSSLQLGPVMALVSGPTVGAAISDPENGVARLVAEISDNAELVRRLFLQFLNRPASPEEAEAITTMFRQVEDEHAELVSELEAYSQQIAAEVARRELERQGRVAALQAQIEARREIVNLRQPREEQERRQRIQKARAALAAYEKKLAAKLPDWEAEQSGVARWHVLEPIELGATYGARFSREADGSIFVEGERAKGGYRIAAQIPIERVTAIRLDALADDRLPSRGPGRNGNGNFVLTELTSRWLPDAGPLKLARSWDFTAAEDDWQSEEGAKVIADSGRRYIFGRNPAAGLTVQLNEPPDTYLLEVVTGVSSAVTFSIQWATADQPEFDASRSVRRTVNAGPGGRLPTPIAIEAASNLTGLRIVVEDAQGVLPLDAVRLFASEGRGLANLKFRNARATFSQAGYSVKKAIDGNSTAETGNGWAISPQTGRDHTALFVLDAPLQSAAGRVLELVLHHNFADGQHSLGRFRLSVTDASPPVDFGLPPQIAAILVKPADQRTDAEREMLLARLREDDKRYQKLRAELTAAEKPLPPDPRLKELEAELAKAQQPLLVDPKLEQLRRAVALSEAQLENKRLTVAQDIVWALINSPAFLYNH